MAAAGLSEPEDPALVRSFRGHHDAVTSVVFHTNMKQVISGSLDGNVMAWNFKPQLRALRFAGHKGAVYTVDFSPTSALIASGSKDRTVRLWQPTVEGRSTQLKGHTGTVRCVAFSPDGRSLMSCSDDKTVKVWALPAQRFLFTLSGHSNWVRSCSFSPDGRLALSGGDDRALRVWDLRTKRPLRSYEGHAGGVCGVGFHPDGTCAASCGNDHTVRVWDVRTDGLLQLYKEHGGAVTGLRFHPSGNFLLTSSLDANLKVWDLREGRPFYTIHGHEGATLGAAFSPAGDFFASCGADEQVMIWKTNFDRHLDDYVMVPAAERHAPRSQPSNPMPSEPPPDKARSQTRLSKSSRLMRGDRGRAHPDPCHQGSNQPVATPSILQHPPKPPTATQQPPPSRGFDGCHPQFTDSGMNRVSYAAAGEEGGLQFKGMNPAHGKLGRSWASAPPAGEPPVSDARCQRPRSAGPVLTDGPIASAGISEHKGPSRLSPVQGVGPWSIEDAIGEGPLPPPLDLGDLPHPLTATMQHIVGEMNVMSQTLALVVERLTMNEDAVRRIDKRIEQLLTVRGGRGEDKGRGDNGGT